MQRGFLVIAVVYVIRAIYSLLFQAYRNLDWSTFDKLSIQVFIIFAMDVPAIVVILYINRKTIRLRKRFEEEERRRSAGNAY